MNKALKISIVVVICLIVILAAALVITKCSSNTPSSTTTSTTTSTTSTTTSSTTSSTTGNNGGDPDCTEHVDANTDYVCDVCGEPLEKPDDGFTATNDKVYVITAQLNVRKTPDSESNPIGSVFMDEELTRLGYYENGWSKIVYDGEECYVDTDSITTSKPITEFEGEEETVYFTQNAITYSKPSYIVGYSEKCDTFFEGESIQRLGVATVKFVDTDGKEYTFAKVTYTVKIDGENTEVIRYVNNDYLTTEAPNTDGDVVFERNDDILVSKYEYPFALRKSTIYVEGDDSEIAGYIEQGTVLQAIGKGVEGDGTVWYKVVYENETYYVIYKETYFDKYETTDGNFENIFGEYNITLDGNYVISSSTDSEYEISNGTIAINVANTGELPEGITAQYFAAAMIEKMQLTGVEAADNNGVVYFEFDMTVTVEEETVTVYCLVVLTEGSNNNFYVTTFAASGAKADLSETFWGYVDTITITPEV